jgi:hypothetical protein
MKVGHTFSVERGWSEYEQKYEQKYILGSSGQIPMSYIRPDGLIAIAIRLE